MAASLLTKRPARRRTRDGVRRYRFTPELLYKMNAAGLLNPDKRYELIQGEIYEMTVGPEHAFCVDNLQERLLEARKPGEYYFRVQGALRLGDDQPAPDIAVIPGKPSDYREQHPTTALLVIEIADTSLHHDRGRKLRLYAQHRIPEYWIVNLKERTLEVYREPERTRYKSKQVLSLSETVRPLFDPDWELSVRSLLE